MSLNKLVSIRKAILSVQEDLGDRELTNIRPLLYRWAKKADSIIGNYYSYKKKISVLYIDNGCSAELPQDAVHVLGVLIGDYGCDCGNFFDSAYSYNITELALNDAEVTNVFKWSSSESALPTGYGYEIQDGRMIWDNRFTDTYITVQYLAYETDESGFLLVNENNLEAINKYIQMKLAEQRRWHTIKSKTPINQINALVETLKRDWIYALRNARATSDAESDAGRHDAYADMLNNPITGYRTYLLNRI